MRHRVTRAALVLFFLSAPLVSCGTPSTPQRLEAPRPPKPPAPSPPPPSAEPTEPLHLGGDVIRPTSISGEKPRLTEVFQNRKFLQGTCLVETVIDRGGRMTEVRWRRPENVLPEFKAELLRALPTWRFTPATLHGKPVAVYFTLTVSHCPLLSHSAGVAPGNRAIISPPWNGRSRSSPSSTS